MKNEDLCDMSYLRPWECRHPACSHDEQPPPPPTNPAPTTTLAPTGGGRVVWSPLIARQDDEDAPRIAASIKVAPESTRTAAGRENRICACGRPVHNQDVICRHCSAELLKVLAETPWLVDELNTTITRQKAATTDGGSRSADTPLPWHERAADALATLHGLLVSWVRLCHEEHLRDADLPADDTKVLQRWQAHIKRQIADGELQPPAAAAIEGRRNVLELGTVGMHVGVARAAVHGKSDE